MVESSYMMDKQSLAQIYKKRSTTVVFTQQPIQPLATFTSGSQIQLVFQNSRNFLDLSKVELFYRPVIQFGAENGLTQFQRAQLCMTLTDSAAPFTLQSIQINGNQICAQPQSNLQVTRSIFQFYYQNFISSKKQKGLSGCGDVFTGLTFSSGSGSNLYGIVENSITHPPNRVFSNLESATTGGGGTPVVYNAQFANSSRFEGDSFPRGLVCRFKSLYPDFNLSFAAQPNQFGCSYYTQQISSFADPIQSRPFPDELSLLTFPLLPLAITPSIALYHKQQTMLADFRAKFIQQTATAYLLDTTATGEPSKTLALSQYDGTGTGVGGFDDGTVMDVSNAPAQFLTPGQTNKRPCTAGFIQTKMGYGISVQNYEQGAPIIRNPGLEWSNSNTKMTNLESYTQCSVKLGDLSCELRDIGLICMENAQVIIQLQVNIPQNCISAYLQPSLIANPYSSFLKGDGTVKPTCYKQFLDACLIGNTTTLTITDTTCRIEYVHFEDDAYPIMKQLMYQSRSFVSIRQQFDVLPGAGIFTQRLSIGQSTIIAGIMIMFIPANRNRAVYNSSIHRPGVLSGTPLPQDSMVDYDGLNVISDLRGTYADSYYQNLSQIYAEVDGKRYAAMDLNISNPQLSTYLVTQAGLQTTLGKYVNLDLQSYTKNRFFYWIPVNVSGTEAMRIQDQQIVITANIDDSPRVDYARRFNQITQGFGGQFGMLSFALTMQQLVDCSVVRV